MNTIENIAGSTTNSAADSEKTKLIGKDDFLKMLIAQLKNQNPLNPLEGTEFAAQLAQFASLEQLTNLNKELSSQNIYYTTMINTQAINLIGKEVIARKGDGTEEATVAGQVSAVNFKDKTIYLTVGGQEIPLGDVLSVY